MVLVELRPAARRLRLASPPPDRLRLGSASVGASGNFGGGGGGFGALEHMALSPFI